MEAEGRLSKQGQLRTGTGTWIKEESSEDLKMLMREAHRRAGSGPTGTRIGGVGHVLSETEEACGVRG